MKSHIPQASGRSQPPGISGWWEKGGGRGGYRLGFHSLGAQLNAPHPFPGEETRGTDASLHSAISLETCLVQISEGQERSVRSCGYRIQPLNPPRRPPSSLPSLPCVLPSPLTVSALSGLSLLGCLLQPTSHLFGFTSSKGPPFPSKDSYGFQSFVNPESPQRSTSKRWSSARRREHFHGMCILWPNFSLEQKTRSLPPPSPSSGGLWQDGGRGGTLGLTFPPRRARGHLVSTNTGIPPGSLFGAELGSTKDFLESS